MHQRKPEWLRLKTRCTDQAMEVRQLIRSLSLHTVCQEAACPNLLECFGHRMDRRASEAFSSLTAQSTREMAIKATAFLHWDFIETDSQITLQSNRGQKRES